MSVPDAALPGPDPPPASEEVSAFQFTRHRSIYEYARFWTGRLCGRS